MCLSSPSLRTPDLPPAQTQPWKPLVVEKRPQPPWPCLPLPPSAAPTEREPPGAQQSQLPGPRLPWRQKLAGRGRGPTNLPAPPAPGGEGGSAYCLCFVRCWVGVSKGGGWGAAISMETWEPPPARGLGGVGQGCTGTAKSGWVSPGKPSFLWAGPAAALRSRKRSRAGGRPGCGGTGRKAPITPCLPPCSQASQFRATLLG